MLTEASFSTVLNQVLQRLQAGSCEPDDLEALRRAIASGKVVLATGERAVALGGSAEGAVIIGDGNIVGNGNIVLMLNARQRADLERLLAAPLHNVPRCPNTISLARPLWSPCAGPSWRTARLPWASSA